MDVPSITTTTNIGTVVFFFISSERQTRKQHSPWWIPFSLPFGCGQCIWNCISFRFFGGGGIGSSATCERRQAVRQERHLSWVFSALSLSRRSLSHCALPSIGTRRQFLAESVDFINLDVDVRNRCGLFLAVPNPGFTVRLWDDTAVFS